MAQARRPLPSRVVLADGVYENLLARLVDGELSAGSSLNIDGLSRELGVSQTPVREALARLEATGLVTRTALRGYQVSPIASAGELAELMDARIVIEPALCGMAARGADSDLMNGLEETIAGLEGGGELPAYWEADHRFHVLIAAHAGNAFLRRAYDTLGGHVQRFRLFSQLGLTDSEFAVAEHRRILSALRAGSADEAEAAMREHLLNVKRRAISDREAMRG